MQVKTVKAKQTQQIEVQLEPHQVKTLAIEYIMEKLLIPKDAFIKDGKLMTEWEESYGSHSNWEEKTIRAATELDKAALDILHHLTYK